MSKIYCKYFTFAFSRYLNDRIKNSRLIFPSKCLIDNRLCAEIELSNRIEKRIGVQLRHKCLKMKISLSAMAMFSNSMNNGTVSENFLMWMRLIVILYFIATSVVVVVKELSIDILCYLTPSIHYSVSIFMVNFPSNFPNIIAKKTHKKPHWISFMQFQN